MLKLVEGNWYITRRGDRVQLRRPGVKCSRYPWVYDLDGKAYRVDAQGLFYAGNWTDRDIVSACEHPASAGLAPPPVETEKLRAEAARQRTRADGFAADLADARKTITAYEKELAPLRDEVALTSMNLTSAQETIVRLENTLGSVRAELDNTQAALSQSRTLAEHRRVECNELRAREAALLNQQAERDVEYDDLVAENHRLANDVTNLIISRDNTRAELAELEGRNATLQDRLDEKTRLAEGYFVEARDARDGEAEEALFAEGLLQDRWVYRAITATLVGLVVYAAYTFS